MASTQRATAIISSLGPVLGCKKRAAPDLWGAEAPPQATIPATLAALGTIGATMPLIYTPKTAWKFNGRTQVLLRK